MIIQGAIQGSIVGVIKRGMLGAHIGIVRRVFEWVNCGGKQKTALYLDMLLSRGLNYPGGIVDSCCVADTLPFA